jgi:hypothetical protein
VVDLMRSRIFSFAQRPDQAMRQIPRVTDADADVTPPAGSRYQLVCLA